MDDLSVADDYLVFLVRRRFASREFWKNVPVVIKIRYFENLNAEVLQAYERRKVNGGVPVPLSWRRWAEAQEDVARRG